MSKVHSVSTGTMAQAFTTAGVASNDRTELELESEINRGIAYFDIQEMISTDLPHPLMKARTLSSMAWSIDTTILNVARGLVFKLQKDAKASSESADPVAPMEVGHIDSYNNLLSCLSKLQDGEASFQEHGLETGPFQELCTLLAVADKWHGLAKDACISARIAYTPKSFEELLKSEKPQTVTPLTKRKLEAIVELTFEDAGSTAEELAEYKSMTLDRQRNQYESMHETRQKVIPEVLRLIEHAKYYGTNITEFWQLSVENQVRLIASTQKTVDRVLTDLSSYRSITELEFIGMIREAKAFTKQLDNVLNTGKFATH